MPATYLRVSRDCMYQMDGISCTIVLTVTDSINAMHAPAAPSEAHGSCNGIV